MAKFLRCAGRLSAVALSISLAMVVPAQAIECRDGYQRVQGNDIATPYCQDELLAIVARGYGVRAPASKIRNNPNFKGEVCRIVGHDIRVQLTCEDYRDTGRRG